MNQSPTLRSDHWWRMSTVQSWRVTLECILSFDPENPGSDFSHSPADFAHFCQRQISAIIADASEQLIPRRARDAFITAIVSHYRPCAF